ncbi:MAG TPA: BlaI/MecI/CopY family transcriptional regulator [Phycisphaerae bacterium]|nr:BlaI/MecI/CopY family transcriptional regulator [Phycisphaerae bacterium]HRW55512.1 BlaI/MecI/CopY family transcriptional regulator [Phycisphaerae bacterium]
MAKKRRKKTKSARAAVEVVDTLPPAELDVLSCVWRENPVTARRIREMMLKHRPMAHGSVVTLLTRLEAKGLVTKDKGPVGKAFLFKPLKKPEAVQKRLVKDMVDHVFGGDTGAMICAVLDANPPTADEVAAVQTALTTAKKKAKKTRRRIA